MAATFVKALGSAVSTVAQKTVTLTLTASTAPGNMVLVSAIQASASAWTSVMDSKGNTYAEVKETAAGTALNIVSYAAMSTTGLVPGDTITITSASSTQYPVMLAYEFAGVTGAALSTVSSASGLASGTYVIPSQAIPSAEYLLVGVLGEVGGGRSQVPDGTWTRLGTTGDAAPTFARTVMTMVDTGTFSALGATGAFSAVGDWSGHLLAFPSAAVVDTTPPSVPAAVTATADSSTQVTVAWGASSGGPVSYRVRDGATVVAAAATGTSFFHTGLTASTSHSYTVSAVDAAGNRSAESATATATTPADGATAPPGPVSDDFERPDSAGLGSGWNEAGGSAFKVVSGAAVPVSTATAYASAVQSMPAADHFVEWTVGGVFGGTFVGPTLGGGPVGPNLSGTGAFHALVLTGSTGTALSIRRKEAQATTLTTIATGTAATDARVTGSVWRLEREGTTLRGYLDGTLVVSTADATTDPAQRRVGMYSAGTGADTLRIGSLRGGTLVPSVNKLRVGGASVQRLYRGLTPVAVAYVGSTLVWKPSATPTAPTSPPPPAPTPTAGTLTFATDAQIASLSTTSAPALRAKGIADGVKNGTYVGGSAAADIDIKSVDTKAGPIALTTAIWWKRTGDASYLAPLKAFILATPKPVSGDQALNEFRGLFGIFAAVKILQDAGQWSDTATCPNHNGDTWSVFVTGYAFRTIGPSGLAQSLRGLNPGVDKTANNWGAVARATHLAWSSITGDTAEIAHAVAVLKKYLGDQTTGVDGFSPTSQYIPSWDNWGLSGGKLVAGIGKRDTANPGLDGVVINDADRGNTGYDPSQPYYGATTSGISYPEEAADYVRAEVAMFINGGYNPRTWGEGGNAFDRMNNRFALERVPGESSFNYNEAKASVYKGGRYVAAQLSQTAYGAGPATPSGTAGLSRAMPYGDWLAPADGSSTWGR